MTIAQTKEFYKNIYDICKKYNNTNINKQYSDQVFTSRDEHTIEVNGSPYDFSVNISLNGYDNDPCFGYTRDTDFDIDIRFDDDGIYVSYYIYIKYTSHNEDIYNKDPYKNSADHVKNNPYNVSFNDDNLETIVRKENSISNAEIDEFKQIINELDICLHTDDFGEYTTSSQSEDWEGWRLISEIKNYIKSIE